MELEQRPSFARCSVDSSKEGEQGDEHEPLIPGPTGAELASPARIRGMKNIVAVSSEPHPSDYLLEITISSLLSPDIQ